MHENLEKVCPGCGNKTGIVLHVDDVPCPHCELPVIIEYISCNCGYSWRESNGAFLDGGEVSEDDIRGFLEAVDEFFEEEKEEEMPIPSSMVEMIHKCLKCGELSIHTHTKPDVYECTVCNFSWEVEEFDE